MVAALAVGMTAAPAKAQLNLGSGVVINDLDLDGIAFDPVTGILSAATGTVSGTIAGLPFTTDVDNFEIDLTPDNPATPGEECSVLHLELAPIDLDLLGLHVDTSPICLDITAIEGGGLLGDLLCSLAGGDALPLLGAQRIALLEGVLSGDIAGLEDLTDLLTGAINGALAGNGTPSGPAAQQEPEDICDGAFEILDLAVGPVNLNLLGLVVNLDDCEGGPVQVCVSADQGQGLLGDLLVGLLGGGLLGDIDLGLIGQLVDAILGGLGLDLQDILDLLGGGAAPALNVPAKSLNQLTSEVGRLLSDGNLTNNELDRLEKRVEKLVRKG
jgi:hypothetical protein